MARLTAEQRRDIPKEDYGDPANEEFPVPDQSHLEAAFRELHNAKDPAAVRRRLIAIARRKGLKLPETVEKEDGKSLDMVGETLVAFGGEVKSLGDNRFGGYLVRFSSASDPDLVGDYFTADTEFHLDENGTGKSIALYQHGLDSVLKKAPIGSATLKKDDVGVWMEAQLDLRKAFLEEIDPAKRKAKQSQFTKALFGLIEAGKMGLSSGTASHLVEREKVGEAYHIKTWPLGLDASLTPTPCEPRTAAVPLKSLIFEQKALMGDPFDDDDDDDAMRDAHTASSALNHLHSMHQMHVHGVLHDRGTPMKDKTKALDRHFDNYKAVCMKAIHGLMGKKDAEFVLDREFKSALAETFSDLTLSTHSEAVLATVKGLADRLREVLVLRQADGRSLSRQRIADLKGLQGYLTALLDDAEKTAAKGPIAGNPEFENRLKLARIAHLKHQNDALAQLD